jgi:hypothetical protein
MNLQRWYGWCGFIFLAAAAAGAAAAAAAGWLAGVNRVVTLGLYVVRWIWLPRILGADFSC